MTKVIGITGGIGSGKSTLSEHLKKIGFLVHESDKVVANMYDNPEKSFINFIKKCGLEEAVKDKKIDKKLIAKVIFNNRDTKKKLEKHIHKKVQTFRESFIKKNIHNNKKAIFVDVPLLLERSLEKQFDLVVCIISTKKNRKKRILKNNKFSEKVLNNIFKAQTTDKERKLRSDIIIKNNKTKKDFIYNFHHAIIRCLK